MIKVGIVGAAGYTGGELLRILIHHPAVHIQFAHSRSQAGQPVSQVHTDLFGDTALRFAATLTDDIDVLFLCLGHGESAQFLATHTIGTAVKIIDLSQDFRLGATYQNMGFVYGLPECNSDLIASAQYIANPGCFATAIQLSILPLVKAGIPLQELHITGTTGSTGAGQQLQSTTQHSWRNNNVSAYKTLQHQHIQEIKYQLRIEQEMPFIPWRGDHTRGIFTSTSMVSHGSMEAIQQLYKAYYASHPFTHVCDFPINMKQIINTNKAFIQLEKVADTLIIHCAIDNLLKGAAGQAVQNMNLLMGLPQTTGLLLKPIAF